MLVIIICQENSSQLLAFLSYQTSDSFKILMKYVIMAMGLGGAISCDLVCIFVICLFVFSLQLKVTLLLGSVQQCFLTQSSNFCPPWIFSWMNFFKLKISREVLFHLVIFVNNFSPRSYGQTNGGCPLSHCPNGVIWNNHIIFAPLKSYSRKFVTLKSACEKYHFLQSGRYFDKRFLAR